jgi:hypothetical protein
MKAYKFRTVENLHFVFDILFKKRLYCCLINQLNDFREAHTMMGLAPGREIELINFAIEALEEVASFRICALSRTFDNHLLWAHYAGGYTGIAIEIELEESEAVPIVYEDSYILWSDLIDQFSPEDAARKLLSNKFKDWHYEEEVRVISKNEYYELSRPITRIIVGPKTSPVVIGALAIICKQFGVGLERMVVTPSGIIAQKFDPDIFINLKGGALSAPSM